MSSYIIRRLLLGLLIIFLITLLVFFVVRLTPGDPLLIYMSQSQQLGGLTEDALQELRIEYGLNKPIMMQYVDWVSNLFHGDLGTSIYYHEKVAKLMAQRFPITFHLGITAFLISTILGITFGLIAAMRRGTWIDTLVTVMSYIGITIPVFWLGLLLVYAFGLKFGWLPIMGYTSPFTDFFMSFKQMIMPVICLSAGGLAATTRQMRSSVLEVARQDYIRTAWSKGLTERFIVIRHILKNSLIPIITMMGMSIGFIFGGSVLVETVFAIPGIGRLLVSSTFAKDYVVIQAGVLVMTLLIVVVNLAVDISYGWFDPRIRYQ